MNNLTVWWYRVKYDLLAVGKKHEKNDGELMISQKSVEKQRSREKHAGLEAPFGIRSARLGRPETDTLLFAMKILGILDQFCSEMPRR